MQSNHRTQNVIHREQLKRQERMTPKVDRAKERLGDPVLLAAEWNSRAALGSTRAVLHKGRRPRTHSFPPTHFLQRHEKVRSSQLVHCGPKPETAQVPGCRGPGRRTRFTGPVQYCCAVKNEALLTHPTTWTPLGRAGRGALGALCSDCACGKLRSCRRWWLAAEQRLPGRGLGTRRA